MNGHRISTLDGQTRKVSDGKKWTPSKNGLLVNSRRIGTDGFQLIPDDIITLGDTKLKIILN